MSDQQQFPATLSWQLPSQTPRSQAPPRYDLWPVALQSAMRLRGALLLCGPGVRGVGWPDSPRVRLAAIGKCLDGGFVAARLTAAWVWQAVDDPGVPLSVAVSDGRGRHSTKHPERRRHETSFHDGDVVQLGCFEVTSKPRTLFDLLFARGTFTLAAEEACGRLLVGVPLTAGQVRDRILGHRGPYKSTALNRLQRVVGATDSLPATGVPSL